MASSPVQGKEDEATPEMIEAGVKVLWESGEVEYPSSIDRNLVLRIFSAMKAAQKPCPSLNRSVP